VDDSNEKPLNGVLLVEHSIVPVIAAIIITIEGGLPIILLGSYLPGKPRSVLFRHLFAILKAARSSLLSVLFHARRTM
jgi:hypothetical protein